MAKFRKKPVVIEAEQFFYGETLPFQAERVCQKDKEGWYIQTLEGRMVVKNSDYVIKGVAGEFYPCRADIFERTYELVNENDN